MRWEEWKFSAARASQDRFVRWTTVTTVVLIVAMSVYMGVRLWPVIARTGVVTMHYNIYLGIDDVRSWPWALLLPGIAAAALTVDVIVAYGFFLRDELASRAIILVGFLSVLLWAVGSFFLLTINS